MRRVPFKVSNKFHAIGLKFPRQGAQHPATATCHQTVILNPYSAPPGEVDSGFNGHHHSTFQFPILAAGQAYRLVDLQAEPMTQAMGKAFAEACLLDGGAGSRIDLAHQHTGTDGPDCSLLGCQHYMINPLKFWR
jgi:hypothetical protein